MMEKPSVVPLSSLVTLPAGAHLRHLGPVLETLSVIDSVHRVEPKARLSVIIDARLINTGEFVSLHRSPGKPAFIRLSRFAPEPHFTFAHELAHFIDNRLLHPISAAYASSYDDLLAPLMEAASLSPELIQIQQMCCDSRLKLHSADRRFLRYLLEPHEVFARSYAQFISVMSNHSAMQAHLRARLKAFTISGIPINLQWDSASFKPIMNAMEGLLRMKGWL